MNKLPKEEDPFWEPPEDVLIGTTSVFLQSLSFALDFDDKLSITDYKVIFTSSVTLHDVTSFRCGKSLRFSTTQAAQAHYESYMCMWYNIT